MSRAEKRKSSTKKKGAAKKAEPSEDVQKNEETEPVLEIPDCLADFREGPTTLALDGVTLDLIGTRELPSRDGEHLPAAPLTFAVTIKEGKTNLKGRSLLYVGEGAHVGVDRLARALECPPAWCEDLPRAHVLAAKDASIALASDHLDLCNESLSPEAFRARGLSANMGLLMGLAAGLAHLHESGFAVGGFHTDDLAADEAMTRVTLRQFGQLVELEALDAEQAEDILRRDVHSFGRILLEAATGEEADKQLKDLENLLDDIEVLVRKGLARPGLSQLVVGTVTDEAPFVYQNAKGILDGLLQLRVEMHTPLLYRSALVSTAGNFPLRRTDQDSGGIAEARIAFHGLPRHVGFYAVADGVGGEEHGERASQTAVGASMSAFHRAIGAYEFETIRRDVTPLCRMLVKVAAQQLAITGEHAPKENRGATTFTGAVICDDRLGLGHLGDSRAYLLRDDELIKLTRDHNLANVKIALGELTEREARSRHEDQRRISRFLGTSSETPMTWIDGFDPKLIGIVDENLATETTLPELNRTAKLNVGETMEMPAQTKPNDDLAKGDTLDLPPTADPNEETRSFNHRKATAERSRVHNKDVEERARTGHLRLQPGDRLVLMSDGLYGEVSDAEMSAIVKAIDDPEAAARTLVDTALDGLASDNVTVIVVHVDAGQATFRG